MGSNVLDAATKTIWDAQAFVNPLRVVVMTREAWEKFEGQKQNEQTERVALYHRVLLDAIREICDTEGENAFAVRKIKDLLNDNREVKTVSDLKLGDEDSRWDHRDEYKGGE